MKVIKIGARWCSGCLVMKPRWVQIETELPWLHTVYLDFDDDAAEVKKLGIVADRLPVFIFYDDNGQEVNRLVGEVGKEDLISLINQIHYKNS